MPKLSAWFIRGALLYLAAGITFGALLLANKGIPFYPQLLIWLPVHIEFLLVGWLIQLALGMAFWILPRFTSGAPRGNEALIWSSLALINLGIWLYAAGSLLPLPGLNIAGRISEFAAVAAFVAGSWQRVRPFVV